MTSPYHLSRCWWGCGGRGNVIMLWLTHDPSLPPHNDHYISLTMWGYKWACADCVWAWVFIIISLSSLYNLQTALWLRASNDQVSSHSVASGKPSKLKIIRWIEISNIGGVKTSVIFLSWKKDKKLSNTSYNFKNWRSIFGTEIFHNFVSFLAWWLPSVRPQDAKLKQ